MFATIPFEIPQRFLGPVRLIIREDYLKRANVYSIPCILTFLKLFFYSLDICRRAWLDVSSLAHRVISDLRWFSYPQIFDLIYLAVLSRDFFHFMVYFGRGIFIK